MGAIIRILLIVGVFAVVIYLFRPYFAGLFRNPRMRFLFSGIGLNLVRIFLVRRFLPILFRALRAMTFFK